MFSFQATCGPRLSKAVKNCQQFQTTFSESKQKSKNDNLPIMMEMLVEMRQVSTIQMMKTMQ